MLRGTNEVEGISVEVTEEGRAVVKNTSYAGVQVLAVELWYRLHALHPSETHKTVEKQVREVLYVKKNVDPGSSISVSLGIPRDQILRVNVFLSQHGRFWVIRWASD